MSAANEPTGSAERTRDAARTRAEILEVATTEFARAGYAGARVDEIAALTRTTKRMIYYYFGSKERLFTAVLERAYAEIRRAESSLDVEHLDPVAATRRLVELTFDHHEAHPDFIRLVSIENIHEAEHIIGSEELGRLGSPATEVLQRILDAGRSSGLFHADADAVDVHAMISSFCFFRVSNRHTFGALFGRDLVAA
ncbi:TetR family transcriptional regulator, partial [Streptomyces sp. NPDC055157]